MARDLWGTDDDDSNKAQAVAIDGGGDVLAAGYLANLSTGLDFAVVKLAGGDGSVLWRYEAVGTNVDPTPEDHDDLDTDMAGGVVADAAGNVLAVGWVDNAGSRRDLIAVKLSGSDGSVLWRTELSGTDPATADGAMTVVVDTGGNALVAGSLTGSTSGQNLAVIKLAAATGAVLWQTAVDGSAGATDFGASLRLDGDGNVLAVGTTTNIGTGTDLTVVKLAAADGAESGDRPSTTAAAPASTVLAWPSMATTPPSPAASPTVRPRSRP